jgi:hypothetical protein
VDTTTGFETVCVIFNLLTSSLVNFCGDGAKIDAADDGIINVCCLLAHVFEEIGDTEFKILVGDLLTVIVLQYRYSDISGF